MDAKQHINQKIILQSPLCEYSHTRLSESSHNHKEKGNRTGNRTGKEHNKKEAIAAFRRTEYKSSHKETKKNKVLAHPSRVKLSSFKSGTHHKKRNNNNKKSNNKKKKCGKNNDKNSKSYEKKKKKKRMMELFKMLLKKIKYKKDKWKFRN